MVLLFRSVFQLFTSKARLCIKSILYNSHLFDFILLYYIDYLSILFPSSSIQLSTQSDHCFLLYLCIFSHYSVQAVRKAVYSCIERILPIIDWQQDPSAFYSIILLLDAVIRETDLQPESIHCFLLLLSSLSTQPQSYLSSLQQSIHHHLNQTPSCLSLHNQLHLLLQHQIHIGVFSEIVRQFIMIFSFVVIHGFVLVVNPFHYCIIVIISCLYFFKMKLSFER